MDTALSLSDDAALQRVEKLTAVFSNHALTHLEYREDAFQIVIKKESPALLTTPSPVLSEPGEQAQVARPLTVQPVSSPTSLPQGVDAFSAMHTDSVGSTLTSAATGAQAKPAQASPVAVAAPAHENIQRIDAPLVGVAYRAKEPGAAPYVEIGSQVEEGTVLCLIEAMKMFNEVKAPCSGTVCDIFITDGELVEFGAPLFLIDRQLS